MHYTRHTNLIYCHNSKIPGCCNDDDESCCNCCYHGRKSNLQDWFSPSLNYNTMELKFIVVKKADKSYITDFPLTNTFLIKYEKWSKNSGQLKNTGLFAVDGGCPLYWSSTVSSSRITIGFIIQWNSNKTHSLRRQQKVLYSRVVRYF